MAFKHLVLLKTANEAPFVVDLDDKGTATPMIIPRMTKSAILEAMRFVLEQQRSDTSLFPLLSSFSGSLRP
jgi:hypothetical protein